MRQATRKCDGKDWPSATRAEAAKPSATGAVASQVNYRVRRRSIRRSRALIFSSRSGRKNFHRGLSLNRPVANPLSMLVKNSTPNFLWFPLRDSLDSRPRSRARIALHFTETVFCHRERDRIVSAKTTSDHIELPLDALDKIDRICDRFEGAWEVGERPRIEDYLGQIAETYRLALICDLLAAEVYARRRLGERPGATEYAARCPEYAEQILHLFLHWELIATPKSALDERAGRSHDTDADREPAGAAADPPRLGGYRIVRELGRGGMGVVYGGSTRSTA